VRGPFSRGGVSSLNLSILLCASGGRFLYFAHTILSPHTIGNMPTAVPGSSTRSGSDLHSGIFEHPRRIGAGTTRSALGVAPWFGSSSR